MTEEQLSLLSLEEKLMVTQFLIADLAANILSEDSVLSRKARHDIAALAMTFSNLRELVASATDDNLAVVQSIYSKYRYQAPP